jgi:hypothetical protein
MRAALIKAEYCVSQGAADWMARASALLPASLLETRLLGVDKFQHFRFWTRRELSGLLRDMLMQGDHGELGNWLDMSAVRTMAAAHIAGRANYLDEIDRVLSLVIAQRTLFSGVGPISRVA